MNLNLKGKKVLLIGSGNDLDRRNMQSIIDESDQYDVIARINKPYGYIKDVGLKTDIIFVRFTHWSDMYWPHLKQDMPDVVAFRHGLNCDKDYDKVIAEKYRLKMASTGLCAIHWLTEQEVDNITVIGFGYKNGKFSDDKIYVGTNIIDQNQNFDWKKEQNIFKSIVTLL